MCDVGWESKESLYKFFEDCLVVLWAWFISLSNPPSCLQRLAPFTAVVYRILPLQLVSLLSLCLISIIIITLLFFPSTSVMGG